jgi:hypothetical protein
MEYVRHRTRSPSPAQLLHQAEFELENRLVASGSNNMKQELQ